tara:strand:+ start:1408 stop:1959 length:552 start_codon:yes stop_codon:yes gene_type:complete
MSNTEMLKVVQGLAQAISDIKSNGHDERFAYDGESREAGLKREEGDIILDPRTNDGFSIKFVGSMLCIYYQSDILLKDIYGGKFENEIQLMINQIKKTIQREYKKVTGNSVTLTKEGDVEILAQSVSRVRSFVQAHQYFKISGIKADEYDGSSENRKVEDSWRKFLDLDNKNKRPQNDTRPKS